jgi:predicted dehydrogenase
MNVGLIGAGLQGRRRAQALKQSKDARLVAIADVNQDGARSLAAGADAEISNRWEDIVTRDDIEIVLVCTPPNLHAQMSLAAMEKGKHVLCEKPLALTPAQAEEMVEASQNNHVRLKCGFNHRHHPAIKQAKAWIGEGLIGEAMYVRCQYGIGGRSGYDKEWRADVQVAGGGQLMDQGMHLLDLCRWFLGEIDEAFGFLTASFWDIAPLEDNAFALLRTQKGQVAQIHASWTQWKNLFSFEISGRDGYIIADGLGGTYGTERAILGKRAFLEPFREEIMEFRGEDRSWYEEWQEFITSIREDREPLGNGYDGLQALRLAHAIYESAQKRSSVKLIV